jgi:hypothetical protein
MQKNKSVLYILKKEKIFSIYKDLLDANKKLNF